MTCRYHHSIPDQRATGKAAQLHRHPGIIDAPHHDHADIGVPVLEIDSDLSRYRSWSSPQHDDTGQRGHYWVTHRHSLSLAPEPAVYKLLLGTAWGCVLFPLDVEECVVASKLGLKIVR